MKSVQLKPIKTAKTEHSLSGRNFKNVSDLHIARIWYSDNTAAVSSVWLLSFWARVKFLFSGRIVFTAFGTTHPPITLHAGDYLEEVLQ